MTGTMLGVAKGAPASERKPAVAAVPRKPVAVLVVDDEALVRTVFHAYLSRRGDDVVLAEDADQALERLRERSFDVLVTDLRMPGRSGVELVGPARELRPGLVSILLTGTATKSDVVEAIRAGFFDYLEKPVIDLVTLGFAVDRAAAQARLVRERDELLRVQQRQNERLEADLDVLNRAYLRLARQDQALRSDLERAQHMQQSLLPRAFPPVRGLDLFGFYQPCEQLAGDFFDFLPLAGDRLVAYIADVAGHGVRSALVTVIVRQLFHTQHVHPGDDVLADPARALALLNKALVAQPFGEPIHVTMGYAVFDLKSGEVAYASAGHPGPVLVRRGETPSLLCAEGPGLGLEEQPQFGEARVRLDPGDFLLLYTDGLPETRDLQGREVTVPGVTGWAQDAKPASAAAICADVEERLSAHRRGAPADDDVTFVVAQRTEFAQEPVPRRESVRLGSVRQGEVRGSQGTPTLVGWSGRDRLVRLHGRACWDRAAALLSYLRGAAQTGDGQVYVDVSGCISVDSTMLGLFLQMRDHFVLVRPSDRVLQQVAELGLTRFLRISDVEPPEPSELHPLGGELQDETEQVVLSAHEALLLTSKENRDRFASTVDLMRADLESRKGH